MIHHLNIKFISDSGARRQQTPPSSRVRFPEQDEDDLLLDVLPFPEERLALQQQRPVQLQTKHMILKYHSYLFYYRQLKAAFAQPLGLFRPRQGHCPWRKASMESETASRSRGSIYRGWMTREVSTTGHLLCLEAGLKKWIFQRESVVRLLQILFLKQK